MDRRRAATVTLLTVALALLGVLAFAPSLLAADQYERTTVEVYDANGTHLTTVEVRVADTYAKRYTGLSDTESLGPNEGMLFVHPSAGEHAYVMRKMDFPLDIVFIAPNGTITEIHHAELPPNGTTGGELKRYRGSGEYVLEVPYGYTNRTGIDEGDRVVIAGDY